MVTQPNGPAWAVKRKLLRHSLNPVALETFKTRQEVEASRLVWDVAVQPESWNNAMLRFVSSIPFSIAYGRRIDDLHSETLRHRLAHIKFATQLLRPDRFLIDSYPILRYLPYTAVLKDVKKRGQILEEFDQKLVDTVVDDLKVNGGAGQGSLAEYMLGARQNDEQGINRLTPRQFRGLLGTVFSAGTDTTYTALQNAILAFVTHPNAVAIAHREIDDIFGTERSPAYTDQDNLPYLNAIIQESIRWRPSLGLSIPHATTEDDVYDGFKIPKGTPIIANTWTMNNLPAYFPRPTEFLPERFLPPSHPLHDPSLIGKEFPGKHQSAVFGWGRRACPGAELSLSEQFIALAKTLWAFDITAVEGKEYDIDIGNFEGIVTIKPMAFEAVFRIRSERHREVLERELQESKVVIEKFPALT